MENRKPFELKQVLIWYNLFQVIFSCWLFNEVSYTHTVNLVTMSWNDFAYNISISTLCLLSCVLWCNTVWCVTFQSIVSGWFTTSSFRCQPVDYSRSPEAIRVRFQLFLLIHYNYLIWKKKCITVSSSLFSYHYVFTTKRRMTD